MTSAPQNAPGCGRVRIWIWSNHSPNREALSYGPIALELYSGGERDVLTYISYWKKPLSIQHSTLCHTQESHFHHTKEEDDQCANGQTCTSYDLQFLNTSKMRFAFEKFQRDQSLGWAIFRKPCEKNGIGLVAYLLEQGGIYLLTSYKRNPFHSHRYKILAFSSLSLSALNLCHSLTLNFNPVKNFDLIDPLLEAASKKNKICELTLLMAQCLPDANLPQEVSSQIARVTQIPYEYSYIQFPFPFIAASTVRSRIVSIAREAFVVTALYFAGTYAYHRFWLDPLGARDIEIMAHKAVKFEQRELYRRHQNGQR